jgi:tRNA A-37 threonylcarbamoyl transferase component Bud32/predicted nucleotidyltransferase
MFSLSEKELEKAKKSIARVSGKRQVAAACVYGSKAAGYARPSSDIDLLVVLEGYPYGIKYSYIGDGATELSVLIVSKKSIQADAQAASLGEFAVGRLLHVYEPIVNGQLLKSIERAYKKRVILEELQRIIDSTSLLGTEIEFPLEYVLFSKIRQRISRYPNATYSYFRTYARSPRSAMNLEAALEGYRAALADLLRDDPNLLSVRGNILRIPDKAIFVDKGNVRLKLTGRLQQMRSYFVHTYAGREIMHLMVKEAESKIRRREHIELPENMAFPRRTYWSIDEGSLITDSNDWIEELAAKRGVGEFTKVDKRRLGNLNSRTILYVLHHDGGEYRIVAKDLARSKSIKWAALSVWTSPVKRFKVGPLFRLATDYKGRRFIRAIGIDTPEIEAVVLDERLLITRYIDGQTLGDEIRKFVKGRAEPRFMRLAGSQIAKVHNAGASIGNIKPKNIVVKGSRLFFTDMEQFLFSARDQVWDIAQFICWDLKGITNAVAASEIAREFLKGYTETVREPANVVRLARSRRYVESFFPVLSPSVARAIKNEIRLAAG